MAEGDTKSSKPRVVDLDAGNRRGAAGAAQGVRRLALALGRETPSCSGRRGRHRNGEHVSRQFARDIARCAEVPPIRLHDLRHSHATILLLAGVPVHVVSQRLGHASPVITLSVYAHVMPGNQREAADLFARLVREASGQ